ncbi:MAG: type III pantothenate kinase [Methylotenera sp.]
MLLTIDAGNTRTKWAVFNHTGEITQQGACLNETLATADLSPQSLNYERVAISNVAGKQHAALLAKKLAPYNLPVHWVRASIEACDVFNAYAEPEILGTDRWAALIAAWRMKHAPCVVVNAGTAVTIDALAPRIDKYALAPKIDEDALTPGIDKIALTNSSDSEQQGEFLGGMILPGLDLMQKSLGLATAQLPKNGTLQSANKRDIADIFAKNTTQAINAGALSAVAGAIMLMANALAQKCGQKPCVILSGGNALAIQNNLAGTVTNQVIIVDNLVLQGLYLLEHSVQNSN